LHVKPPPARTQIPPHKREAPVLTTVLVSRPIFASLGHRPIALKIRILQLQERNK